MDISKAVSVLENANKWRREPDRIAFPNPTAFGKAIDLAVKLLSKNKVYLVEVSEGFFDESYTYIDGVYYNAESAEERKLKIEDYVQRELESVAPYSEDDVEFLTGEQYEVFSEWEDRVAEAREFNDAKVIEFELKL